VTKRSAPLHEIGVLFCSCNEGMGGAYRGSQEREASGREWMFGTSHGMAGMDAFNKYVEQIAFRKWVAFCEHGLKPQRLKAKSGHET